MWRALFCFRGPIDSGTTPAPKVVVPIAARHISAPRGAPQSGAAETLDEQRVPHDIINPNSFPVPPQLPQLEPPFNEERFSQDSTLNPVMDLEQSQVQGRGRFLSLDQNSSKHKQLQDRVQHDLRVIMSNGDTCRATKRKGSSLDDIRRLHHPTNMCASPEIGSTRSHNDLFHTDGHIFMHMDIIGHRTQPGSEIPYDQNLLILRGRDLPMAYRPLGSQDSLHICSSQPTTSSRSDLTVRSKYLMDLIESIEADFANRCPEEVEDEDLQ